MTGEGQARRATMMSRRSLALTAILAAAALIIGIVVAPGGPGGLVLRSYRSTNLALLVPVGWRTENLVGPYGTALSGWVDSANANASEVVRASLPATHTPEQRARARAAQLSHRATYIQSYLGEVTLDGGRPAWALEYTLDGDPHAVYEFNACTPPIAMTVTLSASSASELSSEELTLAEGAEPICDGPAFTSPDRADLAVPLQLPS